MAALNLTQRWLPVALLLAFGLWAGRRYGRRNRWFAVGLILMVTGLAYFYGAKKGLFGAWPPQALIADASKVWPFPAPPSGEHVKDFLDVAAAIATIAGLIISLIPFFKPESKVPVLDRARRDMLNLVRVRWITGLLNQTLNEEVQLTPRFIAVPDALQQSDDALPRLNRGNAKEFPAGTSIANIFEGCAERLLILGAPGAGKTTLLLKLARELLDLAEKDDSARIPVFFPLSSWSNRQLPLAEWLLEELVGPRYRVPRKLAENWIADNEILPLLDGLDTVQAECRAACVEAINQFGRQKGLFSLVVSCRQTDYEATDTKIELQEAVLVQPLRKQDVSAYWERLGEGAEGVRQLLIDEPGLWVLLDTPLMVDVVTRAYEHRGGEDLKASETVERRRHVFKAYVARMFEHRQSSRAAKRYSPREAMCWLSWLADQLLRHNMTDFYIERMQPDWLPDANQQSFKKLVFFLSGLIFVLYAVLLMVLMLGLVFGLILGLLFALLIVVRGFDDGWSGGLFHAGWGGGPISDELIIRPVETIKWSPLAITRRGLVGALMGGLIGSGFGLVGGLIGGLIGTLVPAVEDATTMGEMEENVVPNQGIRNSARNAALYGLPWLFVAVAAGSIAWRHTGPPSISLAVAEGGAVLALFLFFRFGGDAVVGHYALRALLVRTRCMPWSYPAFLDYSADLLLTYKIGGGYRFRHELLQEYFASLKRT